MEDIVRIKSIKIENMKNVKNGFIELPHSIDNEGYVDKSDIIGIYGQNGSGKTTIIESLNILKCLISGEKLPKDTANFISAEEKRSKLEYEFYIFVEEQLSSIKYSVTLEKFELAGEKEEERRLEVRVINESLTALSLPKFRGSRHKTLISFSEEKGINPRDVRQHLMKKEVDRVRFKVLENQLLLERRSLLFSKLFSEFLEHLENRELKTFLKVLKNYGMKNLTVVENRDSGVLNSKFLIPMSFGKIALYLNQPNEVPTVEYESVKKVLEQMSSVLIKIIPDLKITTRELSRSFNEKSLETVKFQLFSQKGEIEFPLKYESAGIKKIISILSSLTIVYNNPNYCLVVDELDAGIFEYLLGEILEIVSGSGKGQLIFTSHNLRPLEVLNKENLVFTTTDRENNYTKLNRIKANNNIRNIYMKNVMLGSDHEEELYHETDSYEIKKAFKRVGSE